MLRTVSILLVLLFTGLESWGLTIPEIRRSVVRISTTSQGPNYLVPWAGGNNSGGTGAGFIIQGNRIMTNAHVVSDARFLTIEREDDPKRYIAKVEFIAHDCDLAVLTVEDPSFYKGALPLPFSDKIPEIESSVSVYGFPIGGDRLSVTTGVVSRVDFQTYAHSAVDNHLAIQTNAAINPGNSGGPVLQDDKVVGVAFQGFSGDVAQNVGYMIPVPVVKRFLTDISDGKYDHYVDLGITPFPLFNPAHRKALGLEDDGIGVLVASVMAKGASDGILKSGDVILKIDGHPVESDGFLTLDGTRVEMPEIAERKFKGESLNLEILREKKTMPVTVKFDREEVPYLIQANRYDIKPRYLLYGGLLFQPLTRDFLSAYKVDDLRIRYLYNFFIADEIYTERPEIIVLSAILHDPINTYLAPFRFGIVDTVNGKPIKTLNDLAKAFEEPVETTVIKMVGEGRPLVLERAAVEAARERIKQRYHVTKEQNLTETKEAAPTADR